MPAKLPSGYQNVYRNVVPSYGATALGALASTAVVDIADFPLSVDDQDRLILKMRLWFHVDGRSNEWFAIQAAQNDIGDGTTPEHFDMMSAQEQESDDWDENTVRRMIRLMAMGIGDRIVVAPDEKSIKIDRNEVGDVACLTWTPPRGWRVPAGEKFTLRFVNPTSSSHTTGGNLRTVVEWWWKFVPAR